MSIGIWKLLVLLGLAVLLFGTGKLTRAFGDLAQGVRNFKNGLKDDDPPVPAATAEPAPLEPMKALPAPALATPDATETPPRP